ncbi:MAG: pectin acetylesterase-family hydrolase [Bacteroidota bacterium]
MTRFPFRAAVLCLGALLLALPACDSDDPDGDDLGDTSALDEAQANPGQWFFVETEGAQCRDGSPTGFGVRFQEGSDDLVIYLEGGGACFSPETCSVNPAAFGEAEFVNPVTGFVATGGNLGLFNADDPSNPIGDWNAVYVPYCTGDVHGGSAPDALVLGVDGLQQFVGHRNIEAYLALLRPAFADVDEVLLTGSSAGGFGSLVNFAAVADAFDGASLTLLDDSGPILFSDAVFTPTLGGAFAQLFNFPASFPDDAGALFQPDGLQGVYAYYDQRYPDATFGLSSYTQDQTIRFFFGFDPLTGMPFEITGEQFEAALEETAATIPDSWGTYLAAGADHTFLRFPDRYPGPYADWLGELIDGNPADVAVGGTP